MIRINKYVVVTVLDGILFIAILLGPEMYDMVGKGFLAFIFAILGFVVISIFGIYDWVIGRLSDETRPKVQQNVRTLLKYLAWYWGVGIIYEWTGGGGWLRQLQDIGVLLGVVVAATIFMLHFEFRKPRGPAHAIIRYSVMIGLFAVIAVDLQDLNVLDGFVQSGLYWLVALIVFAVTVFYDRRGALRIDNTDRIGHLEAERNID